MLNFSHIPPWVVLPIAVVVIIALSSRSSFKHEHPEEYHDEVIAEETKEDLDKLLRVEEEKRERENKPSNNS